MTLLRNVWASLLVVFVLVGLIGFIGLLGAWRGRNGKRWLNIYLATLILLICIQSVFFTYFVYESEKIGSFMNEKLRDLFKSTENANQQKDNCVIMKAFSKFFECCDVSQSQCCHRGTSGDCFSKFINSIKAQKGFILLSSWLIFTGEFLITLLVTFMLGSINYETRHRKRMSICSENPYALNRLDSRINNESVI